MGKTLKETEKYGGIEGVDTKYEGRGSNMDVRIYSSFEIKHYLSMYDLESHQLPNNDDMWGMTCIAIEF